MTPLNWDIRFTPESGHKTAVCDLSNLMSALPQKMSALRPKADMCGATRDVRFGPKADIPSMRLMLVELE
jgi:hypothetical protein